MPPAYSAVHAGFAYACTVSDPNTCLRQSKDHRCVDWEGEMIYVLLAYGAYALLGPVWGLIAFLFAANTHERRQRP